MAATLGGGTVSLNPTRRYTLPIPSARVPLPDLQVPASADEPAAGRDRVPAWTPERALQRRARRTPGDLEVESAFGLLLRPDQGTDPTSLGPPRHLELWGDGLSGNSHAPASVFRRVL